MTFTPEVYELIREGAKRSAAAIVPTVMELLAPKSVVDVGGGEGWWGRAFKDQGAERVLVLDETAPREPRTDDGVEFAWFNAQQHAHWPLEEKFDLALCLEVAEHVPEDTADYLIEFIVAAAPVVLFSAAVPGQGGHGHLNEQWPDYWVQKFDGLGYDVSGALRWQFWNDDRVEPWYRQNLLVAMSREHRENTGQGFALFEEAGVVALPVAVVHPIIWDYHRSLR